MTSDPRESIRRDFPIEIDFPEELGLLCDWVTEHGYPISGNFELRAGGSEGFKQWFGTSDADTSLAQFGAGSTGSMYCLWMQPDGRCPIVHLGSEGDDVKILAGRFGEFMRLLAIGYEELGHHDLTKSPDSDRNPAFVRWVEATIGGSVPNRGLDIVLDAQEAHFDFPAWVDSKCG